MGREIRRVPADWQHPKDEEGHHIPIVDREYEAEATEWLADAILWRDGKHPDQESGRLAHYKFYWEWTEPPDPEGYRPKFNSEPTHYQVYETVSEGTPVSPVFASPERIVDWLVGQGYSREAASAFVESGWAPSFVAIRSSHGSQFGDGISMADTMRKKDED